MLTKSFLVRNILYRLYKSKKVANALEYPSSFYEIIILEPCLFKSFKFNLIQLITSSNREQNKKLQYILSNK